MIFNITVGLKPINHPFFGMGSKSCFYIDNIPGKQLYLEPNKKYYFNINTNDHPFYFTTSQNGGPSDKNILPDFSPTENGIMEFIVPLSYPSLFYYQCKNHPYMGDLVSFYQQSK